jgi:hypothetical protein
MGGYSRGAPRTTASRAPPSSRCCCRAPPAHAVHTRWACLAHALRMHCGRAHCYARSITALLARGRGRGGRPAHARRTIGRRGVEQRRGWGGGGGGGGYGARTTMPILLFSVGETCRNSQAEEG